MSEAKRTITVQVHEADEKPSGYVCAWMKTLEGWDVAMWYGDHWETDLTEWPVEAPGVWVSLRDIAEAVNRDGRHERDSRRGE